MRPALPSTPNAHHGLSTVSRYSSLLHASSHIGNMTAGCTWISRTHNDTYLTITAAKCHQTAGLCSCLAPRKALAARLLYFKLLHATRLIWAGFCPSVLIGTESVLIVMTKRGMYAPYCLLRQEACQSPPPRTRANLCSKYCLVSVPRSCLLKGISMALSRKSWMSSLRASVPLSEEQP